MEMITDKLIDKLKKNGVIFEQNNFDEIDLKPGLDKIQLKEKFDKVLVTTGLYNTQRLFKTNLEKNYEHYISQIFIYFTIKKVDFNFQYTQINDKSYCSRIVIAVYTLKLLRKIITYL